MSARRRAPPASVGKSAENPRENPSRRKVSVLYKYVFRRYIGVYRVQGVRPWCAILGVAAANKAGAASLAIKPRAKIRSCQKFANFQGWFQGYCNVQGHSQIFFLEILAFAYQSLFCF